MSVDSLVVVRNVLKLEYWSEEPVALAVSQESVPVPAACLALAFTALTAPALPSLAPLLLFNGR